MGSVTNYYTATIPSQLTGSIWRSVTSESFSTIRSGAGTNVSVTDYPIIGLLLGSSTTSQYSQLYRSLTVFDTSSIPPSATITSASIVGYSDSSVTVNINALGSTSLEVVSTTSTSTTTLSTTDYGTLGSTSFGSLSYASINKNGLNTISLNSSGISNINKGGLTRFGYCLTWDLNNSFTGTWVSSQGTQLTPQGGANTTYPYLELSYTVDFPTLSINNISSLSNVTTITTS